MTVDQVESIGFIGYGVICVLFGIATGISLMTILKEKK